MFNYYFLFGTSIIMLITVISKNIINSPLEQEKFEMSKNVKTCY